MPDGYDTDAGYLLAASKDLSAAATVVHGQSTGFEESSAITDAQWGTGIKDQIAEPYAYVRACMQACLARTEVVLAAHAEALGSAGMLYEAMELAATEL